MVKGSAFETINFSVSVRSWIERSHNILLKQRRARLKPNCLIAFPMEALMFTTRGGIQVGRWSPQSFYTCDLIGSFFVEPPHPASKSCEQEWRQHRGDAISS